MIMMIHPLRTSSLLFLLLLFFPPIICKHFLPVVMWHGMGDNYLGLSGIKSFIQSNVPSNASIFVHSLRIGNTVLEDTENGYLLNANKQVEFVCKELLSMPEMEDGYNAIGFSQGSQFLRAVAQRCPKPAMRSLITLGGQHQGVYGIPHCPDGDKYCNYIRRLLNFGAYWDWMQEDFVQAEYWHDPLDEDTYRKKSIFLADINNALTINELYRTNLKRLKNFVMVRFNNDTMVNPVESEWFGFYTPGQATEITPLIKSSLFDKNLDPLGLRWLSDNGRLKFLEVDGNHLQFTKKWFLANILKPYIYTDSD
ncbi:unnamed protein product [Bemisia tabaci]|uniref:Palmitoyl-protein thioesterase 1 n=1 Tax=Bemisia tabaci TaxID=7038 RepID=A0A9P0F3A3_BEMTA|nr:unnamed protein product [Bemisia tabaci]